MSITPFPLQGQYPWYDQLEQWGADTQAAAESAELNADALRADVATALSDSTAASAAAIAAAGLVGAPAGDAVLAAISEGGAARNELNATFGGAQVDLSGGDATLTSTPRLAHLVGATAARTVTFPAGAVACLVDNDTDYPVTLTRVGGGVVVLSAGSSIEIVGA